MHRSPSSSTALCALASALLVVLGCESDDDAGRDAGMSQTGAPPDAGGSMPDAGPARTGASGFEGSWGPIVGGAGSAGDAGSERDAADCDVEPGFRPFGSIATGTRVSLAEFCLDGCPASWSDALARAEAGDDYDAGFLGCYVTVTGCGVDSLIQTFLTHGVQWNFDHASGELIGASNVFSDVAEGPCGVSETHAGSDRPDCPDEHVRPLPGHPECVSDADAGW